MDIGQLKKNGKIEVVQTSKICSDQATIEISSGVEKECPFKKLN